MKTIIVIPTYNEAENIKKIVHEIFNTVNDVSILIVDDNSTDGTKDEIEALKKEFNNVYHIERKSKLGLASAYIEGFKFAINKGFDTFIETDADFSHNPKYLPEMIEHLKTNDVVIGSRNVKGGGCKGWGLVRTVISKGGSIYSRLVLNCNIKDLTGGFNGWKLEVLNKIGLDNIISKGYCFQIEMKYRAYKNGFKIKEFPIIFEDRKYGKSKMSKKIFLEALLNVIKIKLSK